MEKSTNTKLVEVLANLNKDYEDRQSVACKELVERLFKVFAQKATEVAANGSRSVSVSFPNEEITREVISGLKEKLEAEGLKNVSSQKVNSDNMVWVSAGW